MPRCRERCGCTVRQVTTISLPGQKGMQRSVTCHAKARATSPHPTPPSGSAASPMALDSCSDPWAVAHSSASRQQQKMVVNAARNAAPFRPILSDVRTRSVEPLTDRNHRKLAGTGQLCDVKEAQRAITQAHRLCSPCPQSTPRNATNTVRRFSTALCNHLFTKIIA